MTDGTTNNGQYSGGFNYGNQGQQPQQQGQNAHGQQAAGGQQGAQQQGQNTQYQQPAAGQYGAQQQYQQPAAGQYGAQPQYQQPAAGQYPVQQQYQQPAAGQYPVQQQYQQPAAGQYGAQQQYQQPAANPVNPIPPAGAGGLTPPPGGARPPAGKPGTKQPKVDPNYRFGEKMKNFTTTVKLPPNNLNVDEAKFLNLLAGSISLTKDEKRKIVDSIPKLRQAQVDELIRIFTEERAKFVELSPKHGAQLKKLEDEHFADWKDIEMAYKSEARAGEEEKEAEELRKKLGL